jgi:hypothetical protein
MGALVQFVLIGGVVVLWLTYAVRTARLGKSAGRDETVWMVYGLLIPGISFLHARSLAEPKAPRDHA